MYVPCVSSDALSCIVATPNIAIARFPESVSLYMGEALNLTCTITLDPSVTTPVTVNATWTTEMGTVTSASPATMVTTGVYESRVEFNMLEMTDDAVYTCTVNVIPVDSTYITTSETDQEMLNIDVGESMANIGYTSTMPVCEYILHSLYFMFCRGIQHLHHSTS